MLLCILLSVLISLQPLTPPSYQQRCMPQDTAFSSLFFKVLMQMLQWLENPAVEDGPLRAQLKALAVQYSSRHRISDGIGIAQLTGPRPD